MAQRLRQWGNGPRTAFLVHGYTDDADTWWQVGPMLAQLGWTVLAPDLRGHGRSVRHTYYTLEAFLDDLVSTVGSGADLVVGHSFGALLANLASDRMRPQRMLLVDPPWGELPNDRGLPISLRTEFDILREAPHWCREDVRADLRSNALLDPAVTTWIAANPLGATSVPAPPTAPTTVAFPEYGALVPADRHAELREAGFLLQSLPDVGHVLHRDAPELFVTLCAAERSGDLCLCAPCRDAAS